MDKEKADKWIKRLLVIALCEAIILCLGFAFPNNFIREYFYNFGVNLARG